MLPVLVGSANVKVLDPSANLNVPALVKPGSVDPETARPPVLFWMLSVPPDWLLIDPLAVAVVTRLVVQEMVPAFARARSRTRPTGLVIEPSAILSVPPVETLMVPVPVSVPSYQSAVPVTVRFPAPVNVPPSRISVPETLDALARLKLAPA